MDERQLNQTENEDALRKQWGKYSEQIKERTPEAQEKIDREIKKEKEHKERVEKRNQERQRGMGNISDILKKAPPPPAPTKLCEGTAEKKKLMKAQPTNLPTPKPEEEEAKGPTVTVSEATSSSEENEEREKCKKGQLILSTMNM